MGKINVGRVLLGGIIAGIVLNIGEFVLNTMVLAAPMKEYFAKHGFTDPGNHFIAIAVGLTLVIGIVMVWVYALIRPRLGAGAKAAIVAAFIFWFGIYFYSGVLNAFLFAVPPKMMAIALTWGLVEYVLAAILGAAVYKEA